MKTNQIKSLSAGIGAGALIAMGGLGVAFSDVSTAQPEPPGRVQPTEITTGETSKQCEMTSGAETAPPAEATAPAPAMECVAPSEPTVPVATPEITGPPPTE
jgi:hypothetical protein